jgi:hypothetical protein
MPMLGRRRRRRRLALAAAGAPVVRRRRRRALWRIGALAVVAGGLGTLRQRKLVENQRRFDLP